MRADSTGLHEVAQGRGGRWNHLELQQRLGFGFGEGFGGGGYGGVDQGGVCGGGRGGLGGGGGDRGGVGGRGLGGGGVEVLSELLLFEHLLQGCLALDESGERNPVGSGNG